MNVKWKVMFTEGYLELSQTYTVELFSLGVNHILKTYFNRIAFRFQFLHNSPFREKTYNSENFGEKSLLLTIEQFFFKIRNCGREWRHQ